MKEPKGLRIAIRTVVRGKPFIVYVRPGATVGGLRASANELEVAGKKITEAQLRRGWMIV